MDDALRDLERLAALGDPAALERLELARRRAGRVSTPVVLPSLGESIVEATVAEWCVGPGDWVKKDQVIAVLDTDKVSVELVAPDDGVLTGPTLSPGQVAPVGATLAHLTPPPPPDLEVEARHDALLAAIVASPEDAALRLEYGDLLVETAARGKAIRPWGRETTALRGELIQLHHRLGHAPDARVTSRLRTLSQCATRTALDLVPFGVVNPRVEGGFLVGVTASMPWLVERWRRLVECAPITSLDLTSVRDATPLLALPRLEHVRWLGLEVDLPTEAALRALLDAIPPSVREVALRGRVAGAPLTIDQTRDLVGPRHVLPRR